MDHGAADSDRSLTVTILILVVFGGHVAAESRAQWVTGPWGACEHVHCGYGGKQYREVWCQSILGGPTWHNTNCDHLPKPIDVQECYKICDSEKVIWDKSSWLGTSSSRNNNNDKPWPAGIPRLPNHEQPSSSSSLGERFHESNVVWSVSQWSQCQLAPGVTSCGKNNGVRYRTVVCERRDSRVQVNDRACLATEPKPRPSQACELLCRMDCVVTPYSVWSGCDASCRLPNRTRTRDIVLPPRHGGGHCPEFSEMLPCDNCTESYTYLLGAWELCQPFDSSFMKNVKTHPLIGYQNRVITCLGSKGTVTSFRRCTEKIKEALLPQHQACIIPQDCVVSGWSPLAPYNSSCVGEVGIVPGYMVRSRTVIQVPLGDGKPCPSELREMVKLQGENLYDLRPCKSSKWILSGWSICESVPGYSRCGKGIQSRKAICVQLDDDGIERPVLDEAQCPQPKPLISQGCDMECNWDCSVSQWSPWSTCLSDDCLASKRKRQSVQLNGKRHRTREVLTLPGPGGQECLHVSESQMCEPRLCFGWNLTVGDCDATQPGGCGIGHRGITAVCVNRAGDVVTDRRCWDQRGSQPWQDCYVPCSEDCVTSEWSSWSSCPEPCSPHSLGPNIRMRERNILAYPGKGGQPCPPILKESRSCPTTVECAKYFWKTNQWERCILDDGGIRCGRGIQNRKVTCHNEQGQAVLARRCEERVKPRETQSCTLACPVDCLVTEWSNWSTCHVSCLDVPSQILPKQRRQRFILQYPENRGSPCPNSLFEERSCLNLPVCDSFYWNISPWSQCILPPIVPYCGDGLRARNVTCKHSNSTVHPLNTCLLNTGAMPKIVDACYVSCDKECRITDWSQWGPCVGGCSGFRFRTRKLIGSSRFEAECKDIKKYPLDEQDQCYCSQLQPIVIGGWSDCVLEERKDIKQRFAQMSLKSLTHRSTNGTAYSDIPVQAYCGVGTRYKAVACRNGRRDMERASKCSHDEYEEEICVVPCPIDCELSEWSDWSECSVTCGSGMQVRVRSILTEPADGGRKCPSLEGSLKETQSRVCHMNCQYYMWDDSEWGSCNPMTGTGCGRGSQSRHVRCKAVSEMSQSTYLVDDHFCREYPRPLEERSCVLPCPGDCVLSEWVSWTPCKQPCNGKQVQKRTRKILRKGTNYYRTTNSDCTLPLHEQKACVRGDNCIEYSWQLSDWTSCLVNGGFEQCGVGHKERYAWCRDQQGRPMENFHCEKIFGRVTEPLVVSCEIPCDIDCLLSAWSDWSPCSRDCGLGTTQRFRTIVQNGEGNGRLCPTDMQQSKPCFKKGCYRWEVSEWSHCQSTKGVCGIGSQKRNVSCVGEDSLPVSTIRCPLDLEKLVMKTDQACRIACPGECRLSAWSQWSDCHVSCQDYNNGLRTGTRARSRAVLAYPGPGKPPCSEALWEELPCIASRCFSYFWTTTKWIGILRSVWCQRSDGLNVTGGCDPRERPLAVLRCEPNCTLISGALCVDTNLCNCYDKYESVYSNGTLIACIMDSNETTTAVAPSIIVPAATGSNVWMYAVLGVGTVFVIAVTAALYNMCELFRTGPRPRSRAGTAKSSQNDLRGSQNLHNEKTAKMDALYNCTGDEQTANDMTGTPDEVVVRDATPAHADHQGNQSTAEV
ncbi:thrombospondin type-1 domain-containing protein 7A-like isoform X2 [Gigantopelta aegis]|uniref:thrombospondin type-1 domain-containing protein 7A-like isoform X2 n=1 Tax=Gigantopelta aegis TaxID=1735272 RepID=UPI001B889F5A|nr:thrombospondin type-1 domain-containing protein 7A-like isoform X2 [Gigantopelta aegis]